MSLDNALWLAGFVIEGVVLGLLLRRQSWRTLHVFSAYLAWDMLCNAANFIFLHFFSSGTYLTAYLVETILDSAFVLSILIELSWSVLRPIRASLPRGALVAIGVLVLAVSAAVWPISGVHWQTQMSMQANLLAQLQQTVTIVRILFFLTMAGCSQLLSIGWRDRELQVATGLGFYSLVSLAAAMLRTHQTSLSQFSHLNQIVVASYVLSLLYWAFSFAQKEAERREFTPKMEQFLLALAGNARATRLSMASSTADETRDDRKP